MNRAPSTPGRIAFVGSGPGDPLVHAKERIGYAEKLRGFADHANFTKAFELRDIQPPGGGIALIPVGVARRMRRAHRRRRGKLLDQARFCLRRQAK